MSLVDDLDPEELKFELDYWEELYTKRFELIYQGFFRKRGINKELAFQLFMLHRLNNSICLLIDEEGIQ